MTAPRLTTAVLLLCFAAVTDAAEKFPDSPAGRLVAARRVLVIAHRGNSHAAPENTLVAFSQAVKAGADLVELDYFVTKDGVQVAFHDKDLDRTTNAVKLLGRQGWRIADVTLDELRRLDAGSWKGERFRGAKIPTLAESLDVIQQGSLTLIEHKAGTADACLKLLREKKLLDRVVVQSFDWKFVAEINSRQPQVVTAALGSKELTAEKLAQIEAAGCRIIGWNEKHISAREIKTVHDRGMKIWVYTVNNPARARRLIAGGIDGIITDNPAQMLRLAAAEK